MNKTLLAYTMVKVANDAAARELANMATPVEGGALGAVAGGTLGLGVQGLRRLLGNYDEDDKPSLLRGALLGALGGGAAGYGLAGDAFRTQGLNLLAGDSDIAKKLIDYGRPSFLQALPTTMKPQPSSEERMRMLLEMAATTGASRIAEEAKSWLPGK